MTTPRPSWIREHLIGEERDLLRQCAIAAVGVGIIMLATCSMAMSEPAPGRDTDSPSLFSRAGISQTVDANGNGARVRSASGVVIKVSPSARAALQCVVDYVESRGVKIKYMRGYGPGTVRGSLHPSGRAIDINQVARDVTRPVVPRAISNAAADRCGVISGARWGYADNGHWNLMQTGRPSEPWPRVLQR